MSLQSILKYSFFILSLIYLWADSQILVPLTYFLKPALISLLLIYFIISIKPISTTFSRWMIAGLVFSIAGDTFLMFSGDQFFMFGLGSFLLTHVFYSAAFCNKASCRVTHFFKNRRWALIFFASLWIALMTFLWPDLGALRIPVLIYGLAIVIMGLTAYNLKDAVPRKAWLFLFSGALLFIASDSVIAFNKFKADELFIPSPHLIIMILYLFAQFFIVEGSIKVIQEKSTTLN